MTASPHTNLDPMTGACLDCGASRIDISNDMFPVCVKFYGPNRDAMISIYQRLAEREWTAGVYRRCLQDAEKSAALWSQSVREVEQQARGLRDSLDLLKASDS